MLAINIDSDCLVWLIVWLIADFSIKTKLLKIIYDLITITNLFYMFIEYNLL